jgi:two-component system sensor histidine kinase/response regulator
VGAVDYITKPFSPPVVRARVRTHLSLMAAQEKLKAQNEELKKTAELREEVERMTKHDLKNPLSVILGISEMASDGQERPASVLCDLMETIQDASLRMLRMINSSLDMFRMEEGTYALEPQQVDITKILQRISAETQRINPAFQNKIKITARPDGQAMDESFWVMGEELLLYSMLANLINNALEASPMDEDIYISLEHNKEALITVRNKGEVPQQVRGNFFDKYVTWGKQKGNGLGTYIAKLITLTHGGEISLDTSQPGETTLIVKLPSA